MFITLPMVEKINEMFGEIVRGLRSEDSDPAVHNFSRNSASSAILKSSFLELMGWLEAEQVALVSDFKPEANDRLINLAVGHGYVKGDLNPNPAGMGLVTRRRRRALSTTWADAPAWVAAYIDPKNPAVRVIASGSGIWHLLRYNTPYQTVALIQSEVEQLGGVFDIQNLWVTTSPGARAKGEWPFRLDEKGKGIVLSGTSAAHADVIIELDNPTDEPWRGDKPFRPYALDLSGLVGKLWMDQGIVEDKFFFDERPNALVGRGRGANKRAADAAGETTWSSEVIAISLI
jgi:hypothetical protein